MKIEEVSSTNKTWEHWCVNNLYAMILGKQSTTVARYTHVGYFLNKYGNKIRKFDNWYILSKL
jgi:hypothetical protein